jgi:dihydropyrimidinase
MFDLAIINGKVFNGKDFIEANIYIKDEKIEVISKDTFKAHEVLDAFSGLVLPALIDPHVHFNLDLGRIRSCDDFYYGTLQAAYGGITTIIDFLDPVDHPDALEVAYNKRLNEARNSVIDYSFHATIKNPQCDLEAFVLKMKDLNINSLKLFTTYSESNRQTKDEDIIELLKLSKKYNFLLLAHIENDIMIDLSPQLKYCHILSSRPSLAETKEALKLASFVEKTGGNLYMVHLSSGVTLEKLKATYPEIINRNFFIESCPHYFVFTNDFLEREDGYLYTLAPPLRTRKERSLLKTLFDDVYSIGTDHCAFMVKEKQKKYLNEIPLGIGGIEFSFDVMYNLFQEETINKMSKNIASLYPNLKGRGQIKEGFFANIFVYELFDNFIDKFHGFSDYSVYLNLIRKGKVKHTINRGQFVIKDYEFVKPVAKKV